MEKLNYEEMWDSLKASYAKIAREAKSPQERETAKEELVHMGILEVMSYEKNQKNKGAGQIAPRPRVQNVTVSVKNCMGGMGCVRKDMSERPVGDIFKEFEWLCKPVIEFLNERFDPHCYAIINEGHIKIMTDLMGMPQSVRD